jgi:hypothetical protein
MGLAAQAEDNVLIYGGGGEAVVPAAEPSARPAPEAVPAQVMSSTRPMVESLSAGAATAMNPAAAMAQKPLLNALANRDRIGDQVEQVRQALQKRLPRSRYPWRRNVITTMFWIGQGPSGYNDTQNVASAWDVNWTNNYGGTDSAYDREGYLPRGFVPRLNPFYIALPFNDVKYPDIASQVVPWWDPEKFRRHPLQSQCKGRWVQVRSQEGKVCFAQWEDVGPYRFDHAAYVFGRERPTNYNRAGLDVSPAVRDYLGLTGMDYCDWRFVEDYEVPFGPWVKYGSHPGVLSAQRRHPVSPSDPADEPLPSPE